MSWLYGWTWTMTVKETRDHCEHITLTVIIKARVWIVCVWQGDSECNSSAEVVNQILASYTANENENKDFLWNFDTIVFIMQHNVTGQIVHTSRSAFEMCIRVGRNNIFPQLMAVLFTGIFRNRGSIVRGCYPLGVQKNWKGVLRSLGFYVCKAAWGCYSENSLIWDHIGVSLSCFTHTGTFFYVCACMKYLIDLCIVKQVGMEKWLPCLA